MLEGLFSICEDLDSNKHCKGKLKRNHFKSLVVEGLSGRPVVPTLAPHKKKKNSPFLTMASRMETGADVAS